MQSGTLKKKKKMSDTQKSAFWVLLSHVIAVDLVLLIDILHKDELIVTSDCMQDSRAPACMHQGGRPFYRVFMGGTVGAGASGARTTAP